ncbi:YEATS-associated helix-containing protein [Paenibacillus kobensis]|uniref:YEATS-associated helix-containing protein n=1 Tax=Paenibacillus kobensis TaxID=59841 RepID=UPI000FD70D84|nr:YEATS-associated helix-containing protein [Paenibacillus kobensis]
MLNVATLVVIMVVTGVIGGGVSHLLVPVNVSGTPNTPGGQQGAGQAAAEMAGISSFFRDVELYKSMVFGVAAVFLLPLFFRMINYDIMDQIFAQGPSAVTAATTGSADVGSANADVTENFNNLMLYISYCLVAAISSKKFIQAISNKAFLSLKEETESLKQANQNLNSEMKAVKESMTEDEKPAPQAEAMPESEPAGMRLLSASPNPLPSNQNSVLQALAGSRYIFRTTEGIAEDCGLDSAEVTEVLRQLIGQKLVEQTLQAKGLRFHITSEGKQHCS